jgi:DNA polymerase-3 subunit alpha
MHFASKSLAVCQALKRMLLRAGVLSNLCHREIPGHGRHHTLSVADNTQIKVLMQAVGPYLPRAKHEKMMRWSAGWGDRSSATNIGIPMSFVRAEQARRQAVTGRTKRSLGIDGGGYATSRVVHRTNLAGLLYSERLEDLRTGDLVWDTVRTIEPVGERECFDFQMADGDRPYAVIEDFLVHNCGKKKRDLIALEREKFIAGCETTGYGAELGGKYFDIIEPFADYAFAKSHAYGYGYIAYQTAYLKANYAPEYLSALLTSVKANLDKAAVYLAECRTMGIEVLVPDVNRSVSDFTPVIEVDADAGTEQRSIVFGLSAVRNVGSGLVALLIAEREANGPFVDFYDFVERVDFQVLNKKTIESLIKAGGFDSLGHPRQGLLRSFEHIIDSTVSRRRERDMGVMSLFGEIEDAGSMFDERPPIPDVEFAKRERLSFEKEMLGLYVSDHPLMGAEASLRRRCDGRLTDLAEMDDGTIRTFGGVVTGLQRKWTRKGDLMAVFVLEDLQTAVEVMVFPKSMTDHGHKLADDAVVTVRARVDARDDQPKLIAMEVEPFEPMSGEAFPLRVKVAPAALSEGLIDDLKRLLGEHPGDSPVLLHLGEQKVLRLPEAWTVDVAPGLLAELRVLLGPTAILA